MVKKTMGGSKKVKGDDYVVRDEKYDKKQYEKEQRGRKTAGMDTLLKKAEKQEGYSKKPKVKPKSKTKGFIK